jgi:hypothetical protein
MSFHLDYSIPLLTPSHRFHSTQESRPSSTLGLLKIPPVKQRRRPPQQSSSSAKAQETFVSLLSINLPPSNTPQIIGPHLYTTAEKPLYRRGLISNLVLFIVLIIIVAFTTLYLMFLNKRHASRRVALGKSAIIVDRSMMNSQERAISDEVDEASSSEIVGGEKAFDDITDLKNEDFIFVY